MSSFRHNLAALAVAFLACTGCQSPSQANKEPTSSTAVAPKTNEVPRYPNGLTASAVFNLRTKCADIVDKQSQIIGAVGIALTSEVSSHYNPDTNRCYAEVVATKNPFYGDKKYSVPDNYRTSAVYDAQTRNLLVFADQEGEKSFAQDWTSKTDNFPSYDQGIVRINQLMQDDAQ